MIVFRNPGLIELDAIRTMGVNVKVHANAFGHFGTGLKYAIATILRGEGIIEMHVGQEQVIRFQTRPSMIRHHEFRLVQMDPGDGWEDIGFSDQLGKNWEPWMVLRELGCNALDEHGTFDHYGSEEALPDVDEDETMIVVRWDKADEIWEHSGTVFCAGRPQLYATAAVQVLEGESDFLFYRGVRAYKLERRSEFTYNVLSQQHLTEDRTIASFYNPMGEIRAAWLDCEDKALLRRAIAPEGERFEHQIDYSATNREPSKEFLDTVLDLRTESGMKARINKSASAVLHRHLRSTKSAGVGWVSSRFMQDEFSSAMEAIGEIFSEDELRLNDDLPLVLLEEEEMEDRGLAFIEEARIYVSRALLKQGRREIVQAILPLILEVRMGDLVYMSDVTRMFVPILMRNHPDLRQNDPRLEHLRVEPEEDPGMDEIIADGERAPAHIVAAAPTE